MENKELFVKELGELFARHNINNITSMEYFDDLVHNVESTLIRFKGTNYCKSINISLDSLSAIVIDIVKQGGLE